MNQTVISLKIKMETRELEVTWRWSVHEFPVDYRDITQNRCSQKHLGREIVALKDATGYLDHLGQNIPEFYSSVPLTGRSGLWGRSLVLEASVSTKVLCSSMFSAEDKMLETHAVATFTSPIFGSVHFRWLDARKCNEEDAFVIADLYHIKDVKVREKFTLHKWKVFLTDTYDSDERNFADDCNILDSIFTVDDSDLGTRIGDLDRHMGLIKISTDASKAKFKTMFRNPVLDVLRDYVVKGNSSVYLVIYDHVYQKKFLACTKLRKMPLRSYKATIKMDGIRSKVSFRQRSPFDPSWTVFHLSSSDRYVDLPESSQLKYTIRELPPKFLHEKSMKDICNSTGFVYNPVDVVQKTTLALGNGTQDEYAVGNLIHKYRTHPELNTAYWDLYLPLYGSHSILHRSVLLERDTKHFPLCGTILQYHHDGDSPTPMTTAEAVFRYPLAGRVTFRQPLRQPWADTTISVDYLKRPHQLHRVAPPRHRRGCDSPRHVFEPLGLDLVKFHRSCCEPGLEGLCRVGDLSSRHENPKLSTSLAGMLAETRRVYSAPLALSGTLSIVSKFLVVSYRLGLKELSACAMIVPRHRRSAIVRDWVPNGEGQLTMRGHVTLTQESDLSPTSVDVQMEVMESGIGNYGIHTAPVVNDVENPCDDKSLDGVYNPFKVNKMKSPYPTIGTADQYELGALGRKHGYVDGYRRFSAYYDETQVSLFGPHSVIGRSFVFQKMVDKRPAACSTIERHYNATEARLITVIASFHKSPVLQGYIRMSQLLYVDGSVSDTTVEGFLKHAGDTASYLNVQYGRDCGPDSPLRCAVGDLTGKLSTINLGERIVLTDSNLPLMDIARGRSLAIFGHGISNEVIGCANITNDEDVTKYTYIVKPNDRFNLQKFLSEVRGLLRAPAWLVSADPRVSDHGECLRLLMRFRGSGAELLMKAFDKYVLGVMEDEDSETPRVYRSCLDRENKRKKESTNAVSLRAYISQHGLHGEIEFVKNNETSSIIRTNLQPTLQYPDQVWRWALHEFPVDYTDTSAERCSEQYLGKEVVDLTEELGYLIIPGKDHAEFESNVPLTGVAGFWGKSIVLKTAEHDRVICASIFSIGDKYEKHAEAKFTAPVAGIINMRWLKSKEENIIDGYIHTDLYHTKEVTDKGEFTQHRWKIFVTDVFDPKKENHEDNCNALQLILDPGNKKDSIGVGDLDGHFGLVKIATDGNKKKFKEIYKNEVLNTLRDDIDGTQRRLYVVLYELRGEDSFLGCAQLRTIEPRSTKAIINMDGIKGEVEFTQRSPFDITWALFTLGASNGDYEANLRFVGSMTKYLVKELPPKLLHASQIDHICNTTGAVYNPTGIEEKDVPPAGLGTQDQYPVGDLLGKYKQRTEYLNHKYLLPGLANELSGAYWDVFLPLHGRHSVVHRSVVLERQPPRRDICASILPYRFNSTAQVPLASAEVIFRYPLVGRIVFRQPAEQPWEDTTIIVESLIHADGANINNTFEHRWAIHENAPGKDYYNWTARCLSAGKVYEPYGIAIDARHPEDYCRRGLEGLCRRGDFTTRSGVYTLLQERY
ncbi:unnamed protein product [Plutella xylostella]|uniref:(diamondback moth) hypothetical protein n=1 Tax=Plutella xylostella TaxID=51655 RepID=A0A8S4G2L4_PLUXY|nr:unnamed protein product [Plutella xylostella]